MTSNGLVGRARTSLGIGCCVALVVSGCAHATTRVDTTSATPSAAPVDINDLIVGVAEVARIAGIDDLRASPTKHQPSHYPKAGAPPPCQPPYQDDLSFGTGWTQYRAEAYAASMSPGPGQANVMADILQSVAVYPDAGAARAQFDRVDSLLKACAALGDPDYDYGVTRPDGATLHGSAGSVPFGYLVKATVLVKVVALGLPDPGRVRSEVLQRIGDRIH